jgi:hypothetical protein
VLLVIGKGLGWQDDLWGAKKKMARVSAHPDLGRHAAGDTSMAQGWREHAIIDYSWLQAG